MKRSAQVTIYLDPQLLQAARERSANMQLSLSAAIVDALKESLLSTYRSDREKEILKSVERNFYALRRLDRRLAVELAVMKEMVGLGMRSFFNHTTPIPEASKAAAILSGKQRFQGYLDMLAKNLRQGASILSDVPLPDLEMPGESTPPPAANSAAYKGGPIEIAKKMASGPVEHLSDPATTQSSPANGHEDQWKLFERRDET
jgi:hypothetical protein